MCTVTRMNFKQLRAQYHISTKDIAKECNLTNSTINKFERSTGKYTETNAREYNAKKICYALERLINKKEDKNVSWIPGKTPEWAEKKDPLDEALAKELEEKPKTEEHVRNISYICKDGKFYESFEVVSVVTREISARSFMSHVSKVGGYACQNT